MRTEIILRGKSELEGGDENLSILPSRKGKATIDGGYTYTNMNVTLNASRHNVYHPLCSFFL